MKLEKFAPSIDFKPDTDSVDDQKRLGSCVAHAGQTVLEIAFSRAGQPIDFSRMFLYFYVQQYAGTLGTTDGGWPNQLGTIIENHGIAREAAWPYDLDKLGLEPSALALSDARLNIPAGSSEYIPLNTLRTIKQALNRGQPVVFAMFMHKSLNDLKGTDWKQHEWDTTEVPIGMHAVACIGYDDAAGRFLCENSWGPDWADGGFFGIPYDYFGAKSVLQAFTFKRLPVPFKDVDGYQRPDPVRFDPETMLISIPSIDYFPGNLSGSTNVQGVTVKLKDAGELTLNGPKYAGDESPYYVAKTFKGERHLGFPSVTIGDVEYSKVLLINPDLEIVSIEV